MYGVAKALAWNTGGSPRRGVWIREGFVGLKKILIILESKKRRGWETNAGVSDLCSFLYSVSQHQSALNNYVSITRGVLYFCESSFCTVLFASSRLDYCKVRLPRPGIYIYCTRTRLIFLIGTTCNQLLIHCHSLVI